MILKLLFTISLLLLSLSKPGVTNAEEQSEWIINSFNSYTKVQSSGVVQISETIDADFFVTKHGIFRELPLNYINPDGSTHYTNIEISQVVRNNKPEKFSAYKNGNNFTIKIGDPDKTISGKNIYTIYYSITGILQSFADYDELYINTVGSNWPVTIKSAVSTIEIENTKIISHSCYEGYLGSKDSCLAEPKNDSSITFRSSKPLDPGSDLTVAVSYPANTIPILTVTEQKTLFEKILEILFIINIILIPISPIITFAILFFIWYKKGRDKIGNNLSKPILFSRSIAPEFTPPDNLKPAEIGILLDQNADTIDITATIIDLAVRNHIKIKETKTQRSLLPDKTDYTLYKQSHKNSDKLENYEKLLLDKLFKNSDETKLSSLKNTFYTDLAKVKDQAYLDLTEKNLFQSNPDKIRKKYLAIGLVMLIISMFLFVWWITISSIIILIFSRFMPQRSAYGFELTQRSKGYKVFIEQAQKYPQKFFEDNNLFNEILPYAIMFGVVDKFAKAAKDMGLKPSQSNWYQGSRTFNPVIFSTNLNQFSRSFTSTSASRPSSSGSRGGGFSGGGFSGGGGGSW